MNLPSYLCIVDFRKISSLKNIIHNIIVFITVVSYISFSYYIVKAQITISDIKGTAVIFKGKEQKHYIFIDKNKNETSLFLKNTYNIVCTFTNFNNIENIEPYNTNELSIQNYKIENRTLSLSDIPGFMFQ